ncbi:MAG: hypothetical protein K1X94_01765 [Sandaracinaceae bacterium]|nr:hypothetical protein [Sandaracinaceae bacterium]
MSSRSRTPLLALLSALALGLGALAIAPAGDAVAQRGLRASVYVTQAAIPRNLTERALIGFARGHQARQMRETTDGPLDQRRWLGNLVIQFTAPIDDLEYHALYYDVTDGARNFIDDMAINVHDRTQRTFVQRITLPRPRFRPNRQLEMVVTVRRAEVGRTRFNVLGEEAQRSGVVTFSEEDTHARD